MKKNTIEFLRACLFFTLLLVVTQLFRFYILNEPFRPTLTLFLGHLLIILFAGFLYVGLIKK